ncbi:arsenate reductase [Rhodopirellula maiorica SM1]|uniref:Arsenate reductase n=1 Tax=Rhodopirellula maiorica SM1 TaxID=1265738 RepID=M5RMS4_9BACT|nr:arsenate reductase [Rhodopirellula maiorica]EMI15264.1 arsenate reductase [Rhodopirellula maiorica SM1]
MTSNDTGNSLARLYPELKRYLAQTTARFSEIPGDRKEDLAKVADYILQRRAESKTANLTFICTHNSRRSQLAQVWAHVAVEYYGLEGIETYSGGTEATAFNPRAVTALQRCGLRIVAEDPNAANSRYLVYSSETSTPQICVSKVYDSPPNPSRNYCAVMTCSQADEACPLVMGCDLRMPIRYEDPKVADDTEFEAQRYDERTTQICSEMLYMMSLVNQATDR